jgi:hypothetical protein
MNDFIVTPKNRVFEYTNVYEIVENPAAGCDVFSTVEVKVTEEH